MGFFNRSTRPRGDLRTPSAEPEGYSYRGMGIYLPEMRRFLMKRDRDVSGVSGTGLVAEGVRFADGTVVIRWLGERRSTVVWSSMEDVEAIHGHGGATRIEWLDD